MSPRTLSFVLLAACSALALSGTWLGLLAPAQSDLQDTLSASEQSMTFASDAVRGMVGARFVEELHSARKRLESEEATLRAWIEQQSAELDQYPAHITMRPPTAEGFRAASGFDADELRRELSDRSGSAPPRPGSWPLYQPHFDEPGTEVDAARMLRDQQRLNLQRIFLLAAASCRCVPVAPPEFRSLPSEDQSPWDGTEIRLHLGAPAAALPALAKALLAPGPSLRLRLTHFSFAPPGADAQRESASPLLHVEARVVVERLRKEGAP